MSYLHAGRRVGISVKESARTFILAKIRLQRLYAADGGHKGSDWRWLILFHRKKENGTVCVRL